MVHELLIVCVGFFRVETGVNGLKRPVLIDLCLSVLVMLSIASCGGAVAPAPTTNPPTTEPSSLPATAVPITGGICRTGERHTHPLRLF